MVWGELFLAVELMVGVRVVRVVRVTAGGVVRLGVGGLNVWRGSLRGSRRRCRCLVRRRLREGPARGNDRGRQHYRECPQPNRLRRLQMDTSCCSLPVRPDLAPSLGTATEATLKRLLDIF